MADYCIEFGDCVIAFAGLCRDGSPDGQFLVLHPDLKECSDPQLAYNDFHDLPAERGVYRCTVIAEFTGEGWEARVSLHVRNAERLLDLTGFEPSKKDIDWWDAFPERNAEYDDFEQWAEERLAGGTRNE